MPDDDQTIKFLINQKLNNLTTGQNTNLYSFPVIYHRQRNQGNSKQA